MSKDQRVSLLLQVSFTVARDETVYKGVAQSFGRSGLTFITNKTVSTGQALRLVVCRVEGGKEVSCHKVAAFVHAVRPAEGGKVLVSASFAQEETLGGLSDANRRRDKRYIAELDGRFRQGHEKHWSSCTIHDVSKSGVCIEAPRAIRELGHVEVVILPRQRSP
ncbi:MAG: hypothetical protein ACYTGH_14170, partial [Planctomycetota bacterium]